MNGLSNRLKSQYGETLFEEISSGFTHRLVTFRVNTLKSSKDEVENALRAANISFQNVAWYQDAYIAQDAKEDALRNLSIYEQGKIYLQSLSSMIPPLILNPQDGESILDMAAAPGGKTTQLSALSQGKVFITACERDKIRAQRLLYNVQKQGAKRVTVLNTDASKLDDFFRFDKILLDAPCSGSGTVISGQRVDFSEKLLQGCMRSQYSLLKKALKLLKKGGSLIYSTCSILSCENEEMLLKALEGEKATVEMISPFNGIPTLPCANGMLCLKPTKLFEGFFVAKITKEE